MELQQKKAIQELNSNQVRAFTYDGDVWVFTPDVARAINSSTPSIRYELLKKFKDLSKVYKAFRVPKEIAIGTNISAINHTAFAWIAEKHDDSLMQKLTYSRPNGFFTSKELGITAKDDIAAITSTFDLIQDLKKASLQAKKQSDLLEQAAKKISSLQEYETIVKRLKSTI